VAMLSIGKIPTESVRRLRRSRLTPEQRLVFVLLHTLPETETSGLMEPDLDILSHYAGVHYDVVVAALTVLHDGEWLVWDDPYLFVPTVAEAHLYIQFRYRRSYADRIARGPARKYPLNRAIKAFREHFLREAVDDAIDVPDSLPTAKGKVARPATENGEMTSTSDVVKDLRRSRAERDKATHTPPPLPPPPYPLPTHGTVYPSPPDYTPHPPRMQGVTDSDKEKDTDSRRGGAGEKQTAAGPSRIEPEAMEPSSITISDVRPV
jgi:hypothetical protein